MERLEIPFTQKHSETWEAMRRFTDECKGISMVTNPAQPHDFTVVVDYGKISTTVRWLYTNWLP